MWGLWSSLLQMQECHQISFIFWSLVIRVPGYHTMGTNSQITYPTQVQKYHIVPGLLLTHFWLNSLYAGTINSSQQVKTNKIKGNESHVCNIQFWFFNINYLSINLIQIHKAQSILRKYFQISIVLYLKL